MGDGEAEGHPVVFGGAGELDVYVWWCVEHVFGEAEGGGCCGVGNGWWWGWGWW